MKSIIKKLLLSIIALSFISLILVIATRTNNTMTEDDKLPPGVITNGPYGENVDYSEFQDGIRFRFRADKLYFIKSKLLGFENALMPNIVAKNLIFSIYKEKKKIFELKNKKLVSPAGKSTIKIKKPEITFPEGVNPPDRVDINKNKQTIVFYRKREKTVYDLNKTDTFHNQHTE